MARLSPISRDAANAGIAACKGNPDHFILSHGNWTACCEEDPVTLKTSCIVCDSEENCAQYEEFRDVQQLFDLLQISPGLKLAPLENTPTEPKKPAY